MPRAYPRFSLSFGELEQIIAVEIVVVDLGEENQPEGFVVLLERLADEIEGCLQLLDELDTNGQTVHRNLIGSPCP